MLNQEVMGIASEGRLILPSCAALLWMQSYIDLEKRK